MAEVYNYSPYNLPASAQSVIPGALGQDFLSSLQQSMEGQETQSIRDLMENQQSRGMLQSGDTDRKLLEDVLGPAQARQQNALTGLALQGAQTGEQQQFQSDFATTQRNQAFAQQQQFAQQQFDYQLQAMKEQASLQQQLMILQNQLYQQDQPSFGETLGQNFAGGFGRGLGSAFGSGAGAAFGF